MIHSRFEIRTKLGPIGITPTGLSTLRVHSDGVEPNVRLEVTSRGVNYHVSINLVHEQFEWRTSCSDNGQPRRWSILRADGNHDHASPAAEKAIKYAVLEAVTEWTADHPEAMVEAERLNLVDHVADCWADVERARGVLSKEEWSLDAAKVQLAAFEAMHGPMPVSKGERR